MARATVDFTIPDGYGRDVGKVFRLTEMPATQGELWAIRALGAMARAGVNIPDGLANRGWEAVGLLGISAIAAAPFDELKPLLDEMMGCVQSVQPAMLRPLVETDIEEVRTRALLRDKVFELHAGFSVGGFLLTLASRLQTPGDRDSPTDDTPISLEPSEPSSPPDSPPSPS